MNDKVEKALNFLRTVDRTVVSRPELHIPVAAAGGALIGGLGAKAAARMLADVMMSGSPHKQQVIDDLSRNRRIQMLGVLLGGLAGGGMASMQHFGTKGREKAVQDQIQGGTWPLRRVSGTTPGWMSGLISKTHADEWGSFFEVGADRPTVSVSQSMGIIADDPYLPRSHKEQALGLIQTAGGRPFGGSVSRNDLVNSAVKHGVNFVKAYAFGQGMGTLFGLPKPLISRLSKAGGVANALWRSGVLKDEG